MPCNLKISNEKNWGNLIFNVNIILFWCGLTRTTEMRNEKDFFVKWTLNAIKNKENWSD